MSKLQELIRELCPDGVEYKKLGEVSNMQRGTVITKKDIIEGDIPVIAGGQKPAYYCNRANRTGETITVAGSGAYAGYVAYWNSPIFVSDAFSIKGTELCKTKYLYYLLLNMQEKIYSTKKGAGVPHVHIKNIDKFEIPIPPLEVQEEIVRILDHFTNLAAELQAELQARKEQYEYYRNKLLTFDKIGGGGTQSVTWMKMSEIGTFIRGNGLQKKDFTENGVPCIHYGQIYTYYGTSTTKTKSFVSEDTAKKCKKAHKGDLVIASTSENVADVGKTVAWLGEEDVAISNHTFIFSHNQNPKYLSYLFQTEWFAKYKKTKAVGVKVIDIPQKALEDLCIPIPSFTEQERIVSILDKFETLVNDLTEGLPAEIAVVQEQYEYYRNKLLSFPRTKISA